MVASKIPIGTKIVNTRKRASNVNGRSLMKMSP